MAFQLQGEVLSELSEKLSLSVREEDNMFIMSLMMTRKNVSLTVLARERDQIKGKGKGYNVENLSPLIVALPCVCQ